MLASKEQREGRQLPASQSIGIWQPWLDNDHRSIRCIGDRCTSSLMNQPICLNYRPLPWKIRQVQIGNPPPPTSQLTASVLQWGNFCGIWTLCEICGSYTVFLSLFVVQINFYTGIVFMCLNIVWRTSNRTQVRLASWKSFQANNYASSCK